MLFITRKYAAEGENRTRYLPATATWELMSSNQPTIGRRCRSSGRPAASAEARHDPLGLQDSPDYPPDLPRRALRYRITASASSLLSSCSLKLGIAPRPTRT